MEKATVYFTKDISAGALQSIYRALGVTLKGKVAVKISTGEPGGHNFLQPALIAPLVKDLNGTIVECNTAYEGRRNTNAAHWETMRAHGFMDIAPCDLMDEHGEMSLPVTGGKHLRENFVGENLKNYGSMLVLSHFKGHPMAGLGGALKNMSIGVASAHGKQWIHTSGSGETSFEALMSADRDSFLESMADAAWSIHNRFAGKAAYINVMKNMSVDCDCCAVAADPKIGDIGILASLDPVALDQACLDLVYASEDPGKADLIQRIESLNGVHTVEAAASLGIGSREYDLVSL